ncbi:MAG: PqqD family protein [Candidatus Melainabacteria bacterium]|nr:MAG: PqqD family protein [Candidatus Melainabacteria bacterium]
MNITKPKRSQEMESTSLPDGMVILVNKKTSWAHTLSPLGALVWEFCDGENSVEEIVSNLKAIPEVGSRPTLEQEVSGLVKEFEDEGFFSEAGD